MHNLEHNWFRGVVKVGLNIIFTMCDFNDKA